MQLSRLPRACITLCFLAVCANLAISAEPAKVDYHKEIRPLLSNYCYKCHGPDDKERQAGLRFDQKDGAFARLASGTTAVVPGSSSTSAMLQRLISDDPNQKMPPPASGKVLTPQQIETIKRWLDEGAEWRDHWSFIPPKKLDPPAVKLEAPAETAVKNPIDQFVLAKVQAAGLAPSAPAEKLTLIRRATFDLTGLPPTPAEIDAFLADSSANAYEQLLDRLLASPRYGEHMARYWLDAVRYGDSHGLHFDNERSIWPYRDWVINSFNRNQPFDQFTIEQLAGDLLPESTLEQKIASGFNRCNVSTSEGGSINDEVLVRYAVDRTEALGTVWMGLTLGCAVCHSHKFDPVSQKEFYQLYAFFNGAADAAMDGNALGPPPIMKIATAEQTAQLAAYDQQIADVRQRTAAELAAIVYQEPPVVDGVDPSAPKEYVWIEDAAPAGANLQGDTPWEFVAGPGNPVFSGEKATKRTAPGLSQHFFTGATATLRIGEGDKLFAYVYIDPIDPPKAVMLQFNDGAWEHRAYWGEDAIPFGVKDTPGHVPAGEIPKYGEWIRLEIEAARVGLAPGAVLNGWAFTQFGGTVYWDHAGIVSRTPQAGQGFESQLVWEAFEKSQAKPTAPANVLEIVKLEPAARNLDQAKVVRDYFVEHVYSKTRELFDGLHKQATDLTNAKNAYDAAIPTSMVMADMPQPRETFVLVRGAYDKHADKVEPGVPAVFPPLPADAPKNRLALARWLVDPSHPLTARVIVNRFWQQYFGTGIVKTAEDFGSQGQTPTHPELLDWLATQFIASGWDVKAMQKLILMSGTYQQSSRVTPELLQRDPANELLARGPRFRLDGEVLRDTALAVSGLLVEKRGGRSVKPYQPEGLWEAVSFLGSTTGTFKADTGEGLYRRSMYTFWKRTSPPPSLTTFDAPSRETCTVRRGRTNTPLQALTLMNDTQFVEAARKLAERTMTEGGSTLSDRVNHLFRVVLGRLPAADEQQIVAEVHAAQLALFAANQESAAKLLAVGETPKNAALDANELAALTMVANLVLNLDEAVTKE